MCSGIKSYDACLAALPQCPPENRDIVSWYESHLHHQAIAELAGSLCQDDRYSTYGECLVAHAFDDQLCVNMYFSLEDDEKDNSVVCSVVSVRQVDAMVNR